MPRRRAPGRDRTRRRSRGQLREQQGDLEARIEEALLAHPDGPIFASLPLYEVSFESAIIAELERKVNIRRLHPEIDIRTLATN